MHCQEFIDFVNKVGAIKANEIVSDIFLLHGATSVISPTYIKSYSFTAQPLFSHMVSGKVEFDHNLGRGAKSEIKTIWFAFNTNSSYGIIADRWEDITPKYEEINYQYFFVPVNSNLQTKFPSIHRLYERWKKEDWFAKKQDEYSMLMNTEISMNNTNNINNVLDSINAIKQWCSKVGLQIIEQSEQK